MSDLIGFLEARIAEDEAAEAAKVRISDDKIKADFGHCTVGHQSTGQVVIKPYDGGPSILMEISEYRSRYAEPNPDQRVLAECAAKRAMLANVPKPTDVYDLLGGTSEYVLRCMAAVYSTHPDYQNEWGNA